MAKRSTVAAQQGTSAADWTIPRRGPAFMQKDTRHLLPWLATVDGVAVAAGEGEGGGSAAVGEG